MTTVAIHQPQYLPYLGFFHKMAHCDIFVVLDNVQFQTNGHQNRNKIKNSTGWQWLTVPVLQHLDQQVKEVQIKPGFNWARKHSQALRTSYGGTPHYHWCWERLQTVYEKDWLGLCPLNMELNSVICEMLEIRTPLTLASNLSVRGERSDLLIDICKALDADVYISGPGGKNYMELEKFEAAGIEVRWQEFALPVYDQVFPAVGFVPGLAVVDALCSCGPLTRSLIK